MRRGSLPGVFGALSWLTRSASHTAKGKSAGALSLWAPADQGVSGRAGCASRAAWRERGKEGSAFARRECPFGKDVKPRGGSVRRREPLRGKAEGAGIGVRCDHLLLLAPSGRTSGGPLRERSAAACRSRADRRPGRFAVRPALHDHSDALLAVMSIYETEPLSHVTLPITMACSLSPFGRRSTGSGAGGGLRGVCSGHRGRTGRCGAVPDERTAGRAYTHKRTPRHLQGIDGSGASRSPIDPSLGF